MIKTSDKHKTIPEELHLSRHSEFAADLEGIGVAARRSIT